MLVNLLAHFSQPRDFTENFRAPIKRKQIKTPCLPDKNEIIRVFFLGGGEEVGN